MSIMEAHALSGTSPAEDPENIAIEFTDERVKITAHIHDGDDTRQRSVYRLLNLAPAAAKAVSDEEDARRGIDRPTVTIDSVEVV